MVTEFNSQPQVGILSRNRLLETIAQMLTGVYFRYHEDDDAKIVSDRPDRQGVERFRTYPEKRPLRR